MSVNLQGNSTETLKAVMDNTAFHVFLEDSGIVHRGVLAAEMLLSETVSLWSSMEEMCEEWD